MNDDGEFELVLGNKQLFSVFFIVVVLLGVCFLMGYVVGKNSAPVLNAAIAPKDSGEPLVIPPVTELKDPADVKELTAALKETSPQVSDDKAPAAKATPEKAAPVKDPVAAPTPPPTPKPEPVKTVPPPAAKQPLPGFQAEKSITSAPKQVPLGSQPIAGRVYLQLSATDRDSAEGMADLLRGKGFTAIAAQIPERKELYRVLVGPLNEADVAKARADLKANKFPSDEAVRRVF